MEAVLRRNPRTAFRIVMKNTSMNFESLPSDESYREVCRITWFGLWANLVLSGMKFIAGIVGHSSVLIADAVHSLSDLVTDAAVLIGVRYWGRPADDEHPHGHAKIETLVTLLIGIALFLVAMELLRGALASILDLLNDKPKLSPTWFPFVAALISVGVKEYLYQITLRTGMRLKSSALIANAWHHRSDALSSVPAAAAVGACLVFGDQYLFLDPVGAVVVALMIVHAAWRIVRSTFAALLDSGASKTRCQEITAAIRDFGDVRDLHKLRTRQVGPSGFAVDVHVQVDPLMSLVDAHALSHRIKEKLHAVDTEIIDVFVHVEPALEFDPLSSMILSQK